MTTRLLSSALQVTGTSKLRLATREKQLPRALYPKKLWSGSARADDG